MNDNLTQQSPHSLTQKRLLLLDSARAAIVAGDADLANLVLTNTLR